jgi:ABC-type transport system substrate-binding protein
LRKYLIASLILSLLIFIPLCPLSVDAMLDVPNNLNAGPYVDKVIYRVIPSQDQRLLALQAGEIEMDASFFDPVYYTTLDLDPNIGFFKAVRSGYGQITINCRDAPLNESVLRRAFAFAFDKTRVTSEIMDGWSQEHDSLVPYPNGWCIEDQLLPHYYTAQVSTGNALLDASGVFAINPSTGYREYNGQPFDIKIEYGADVSWIGKDTTQIAVDALLTLHVNASVLASRSIEMMARLDSHDDYDMITYDLSFYNNSVDWLAYEYWSEYADIPYQNPTNFKNATYDACRQQLLFGTTYEEVYNASSWMQKILQEQVPRLVVYENTYNQAYRTDKFTGFVEDLGRYITGSWTMRKIHRIDGSIGGTASIAIQHAPDSFNIYMTNSAWSTVILENLWPSLYSYGPDLKPWPYLAEHLTTETHADNIAVPSGHTRFTVDIIQNATWSDGIPLTADDVAFTFIYILESGLYGNPGAAKQGPLVAAYAPSDYRVVFEYSTESYWHFSDFAFEFIIPEHIFNNETGIGYDGWDDWNPVFDPAAPNVSCGPFILSECEPEDHFLLSFNPLFQYGINRSNPTTDNITTTETITAIEFTPSEIMGLGLLITIPIVAAIVFLRRKSG